MKKLNGESMDITEENIKAMEQLFPEAFEEGKIDFGVLRQLLGDFVDDAQEKYSFKWNGKGKALRLSQTPSMGTLRPCREESKDWDNTENLYIEGDNLEVLKLLQKSYYGKVKMIYIDPPYNIGNDFVYKDNFRDNIQNYKEITGQVDGEGNRISTNTEANGRFHTDWLNMIYPRLRLARNLLSDDGIIFISIDDNEVDNILSIGKEIFGINNYIATFIWEKRKTRENRKIISVRHDYVICFVKNYVLRGEIIGLEMMDKDALERYKNPDNDFRGAWTSVPAIAQAGHGTQSQFYTLVSPKGLKFNPPSGSCWRYTKEKMAKAIEDNRIWFGSDGTGVPRIKKFLDEGKQGLTPETILFADKVGTNDSAKRELVCLFDGIVLFETPKPVSLIKHFVRICCNGNDGLYLDFFAGSATTAHAVMQLNAEDGGKRKFIMVQLPEPTDEKSDAYKAGYKNICEIGKERIRRAGDKIKAEAGDKAKDLDIGFKVFKLDSSNLQKWNPQPENMVENIQLFADNFLPDRSEQDVLYEIILKMGLDLSCPIEEVETVGETIYIIGDGALMICLGADITTAVADQMVKLHQEYDSELWQVVFRDTGFASDMDKTNIKEILKSAGLAEDSFVCV